MVSLFKVNRGNEVSLPTQLTDGWVYFCMDTGSIFIDCYNSTNNLVRSKISAEYADKLRYVQNGEMIELTPQAINTILNNKVDKTEYNTTVSGLSGRIDGIENDIKTTNESLSGVSQEFENYKTTNDNAVSTNVTEIANNKSAIEDIKGDYLTSTDKEQLEDTIDTRVGEIENNFSEYQIEVEERFTEVDTIINNHVSDTNNPHGVTKEQIGLENVDNTSDIDKPISYATQAVLDEKANTGHTHDASDITDGTLGVGYGGTGYYTIVDNTYTVARYRASALVSTETIPYDNGVINWVYE